MVRAAEIEILTQNLFEEHAAVKGAVKDLGEGELRMQDGEVVADPRGPVPGGEGMRQPCHPLAEQGVDPQCRDLPRDGLHRLGLLAAQDAVVECLEADAPLRQLPLEIFVPVEAELRVVGEVRVELHKQGTKSSSNT